MFLKKTKEGVFINEKYEKANRIAGYAAAVAIIALFIVLLVLCFNDESHPVR